MAVYKCKVCAGSLNVTEDQTTATCEYCGTQQALPKNNNDLILNLYDRANHFRRNNEFDKAEKIYNQILIEDYTDAEAYWSLVLCKYGIEYVEDPKTSKRIPTVNRAQFTSIYDDENYKKAIEYADAYQKEIFEKETKIINEIQKGILSISQNETPYDVFISYKETDEQGRRTRDSVLANDLYHQLIKEGYKVFFSRITLEAKLGVEYEPYIFAALNSAKVMVVIGTKQEFFNAVWVKNEWSRFLSIVKESKGEKILIPAYRDMDPYDLPEEFSHLQAQDMSKLGFMQDLIRGINKILQQEKTQVVKETIVGGAVGNIEPLLNRGFLYLEEKNWTQADEYFERALDLEYNNVNAYLGKLLSEIKTTKKDDLIRLKEPFDDKENYSRILRFDPDGLGKELQNIIENINERNRLAILEEKYLEAKKLMLGAKHDTHFMNAYQQFKIIFDYKDSNILAEECLIKYNKMIYERAVELSKSDNLGSLNQSIAFFRKIADYKDSKIIIKEVNAAIKIIVEREKRAKQKRKKIGIIVGSLIASALIFIIILNSLIIPTTKYNKTLKLVENNQYSKAIESFEGLKEFRDSSKYVSYLKGKIAFKSEEYEISKNLLNKEPKFKDSNDLLIQIDNIFAKGYLSNFGYYYFGKYPQTVVDDEVLIVELDKLTKTNSNGYYVYEGNEYAKLSANPYGTNYTFNNGSTIVNNKTYYFKVEPIKWRILEQEDGTLTLLTDMILDQKEFYPSTSNRTIDGKTIYANNYEHSTIRKWLNNDFYNKAFDNINKELILTSFVDNSASTTGSGSNQYACDDTYDKVYLLSYQEARYTYFSNDTERQAIASDYARARNVYVTSNNFSYWWLRSPDYSRSNYASSVYDAGRILYDYVPHDDSGARPALKIKID